MINFDMLFITIKSMLDISWGHAFQVLHILIQCIYFHKQECMDHQYFHALLWLVQKYMDIILFLLPYNLRLQKCISHQNFFDGLDLNQVQILRNLKLKLNSKLVLNLHLQIDLIQEEYLQILHPSANILLPMLNHQTNSLHIKI